MNIRAYILFITNSFITLIHMYNSLNNNEKPYIVLKNTKDIGSRISEIITIIFLRQIILLLLSLHKKENLGEVK